MKWFTFAAAAVVAVSLAGVVACQYIPKNNSDGSKETSPETSRTPEITEPETTAPDTTEPESSVPETTEPESSEPLQAEFVKFKLCISNSMAESEFFEAEVTEKGLNITYYIARGWDEDDKVIGREIFEDPKLLQAVNELFISSDVRSWDGFSGSDPEVLDGGGFDIEVEMADGSTISASGSNAYPEGYWDFERGLRSIVSEEVLSSADFINGSYGLTVPESWLGLVKVSYSPEFTVFEINEENANCYLLRLEVSDSYPEKEENTLRLGTLTKDGEVSYLSAYLYRTAEWMVSQFPEKYTDICLNAEEMIQTMLSDIQGINGYEFKPYDASVFYEVDGKSLFEDARRIYMNLYEAAEYSSGMETITVNGVKYREVYGKYERGGVYNLKDLKKKMLEYFSESHTNAVLTTLTTENRLIEKDNTLYARFDSPAEPDRYGSYYVDSAEQVDESHAVIYVVVRKASDTDEKYYYSEAETIAFHIERNNEGEWVFTDFPFWNIIR